MSTPSLAGQPITFPAPLDKRKLLGEANIVEKSGLGHVVRSALIYE